MSAKLVVFIRAYNDLDHITPILYKLLSTSDLSITAIFRTPPAFLDDFRVTFLRQFAHFSAKLYWDFLPETPRFEKGFLGRWGDEVVNRHAYHPLQMLHAGLKKLRPAWFVKPQPDIDAMLSVLRTILDAEFADVERKLIAIDWIGVQADNLQFAEAIVAYGRTHNISVVELPHGDSPYANRIFNSEAIDFDYLDHFGRTTSDVVIVPNALTAARYSKFRDESRLKIFGSPRYCDEWLAILHELVPSYDFQPSGEALKVALFLRPVDRFPIHWEEVMASMKLIAQFVDVYLVVMHHTRGDAGRIFKIQAWASAAENLHFVGTEVNASALVRWADVVLDLGTSASFEAVQLNKPLLALDHAHANISTTAHFLPACATHCRDDLYTAIDALRQNKTHRQYSDDERQTFIQQMIHTPDEGVLERYIAFLMAQF